MRKQGIALAALCLLPATVHASSGDQQRTQRAKSPSLSAPAIARRMAQALLNQTRVEVRGQMLGPGRQDVSYFMRYQAQGREYLSETGGMWNRVQLGRQRMSGLQTISIGKRVYSTTDGTHWMRGTRLAAASALDAISVNPANVPCCVVAGRSAVRVVNLGQRAWHGVRVYALDYTVTSVTASATGTLFVSTRSWLPVAYTEAARLPVVHGTFTVSYGGTYTITAPHIH